MERLDEKSLHNIQLKEIRVISLNSFVDKDSEDYETENIKVETNIGNFSEVINSRKGKTYLKIKIEGKKDEELVFRIELLYEGLCESQNDIDKEEYEFYLNVQSVPMLWSYARETVNNTMLKMGLKPILLPVLNITELIEKMKSKDCSRGE